MTDISTMPMYIPILVSLAILVVPGVVIESYWWWTDRRDSSKARGDAEESPARGSLTHEEEERKAS